MKLYIDKDTLGTNQDDISFEKLLKRSCNIFEKFVGKVIKDVKIENNILYYVCV